MVASGEKGHGPLKFARRADGSAIFVPLMVVNGREDGPVLNVSGGCHGDEYEGMEAVRRAYYNCDPGALKGAIKDPITQRNLNNLLFNDFYTGTAEFAKFIKSDFETFKKVAEEAGVVKK